ncbi:hypothetical protein DID77_02190 [Candidatus Marinamargulisbacteria bacterium SCGC AG-439-L15]|nr:hypothetical protein DID77_02190 [Candidatus Marinamargulisbacteria bacterium SCGC AG-439-L15]
MTLQSLLHPLFSHFFSDIEHRLSSKDQLSWLFTHSQETFIPDYLTLPHYGHSRFKQRLNHGVSTLCPPLWDRFIWPRYTSKLTKELQALLLKQSSPSIQKTVPTFIAQLKKQLDTLYYHKQGHLLSKACFTDLYKLIAGALRIFETINNESDLFQTVKIQQNRTYTQAYTELRTELLEHPHALQKLLYLVTRANWLDITNPSIDTFDLGFLEEINLTLEDDSLIKEAESPFFQIQQARHVLTKSPQTILYELDNCGEVIIDLLLIEHLLKKGHKVVMVAKEHPILNDITYQELTALLFSDPFLHFQAYINAKKLFISHNGSSTVGKDLYQCPLLYQQAYAKCDLVILKGQGNLQSMPLGYAYQTPILYLSGIRSSITHTCMRQYFKQKLSPEINSFFCYYYDPKI